MRWTGGSGGALVAVKKKSWIQPTAVAKYFSVSHATVRRWISDGKLRAAKLPTGHLRILARDVVKFLLRHGKPIPGELGDLSNKHVLIVDPAVDDANTMARVLRSASGCKVSVAGTALDAKGLLNGLRPDLVLLGVRQLSSIGRNGGPDMVILARGMDDAAEADANGQEVTFSVSDILQAPVNDRVLAARVAHVLLG